MKLGRLQISHFDQLSSGFALAFKDKGLTVETAKSVLQTKYAPYIEGGFLPTWGLFNDNNELASAYTVLPRSYRFKNRDYKVGLVCDVFTLPNYQRQGLFEKLGTLILPELVQNGFDFTFGFPSQHAVVRQHLKVGWKYCFEMKVWAAFPIGIRLKNLSFFEDAAMVSPRSCNFQSDGSLMSINPNTLSNRFQRSDVEYRQILMPQSDSNLVYRFFIHRGVKIIAIVHLKYSLPREGKELLGILRKVARSELVPLILGCWNDSYSQDLNLPFLGFYRTPVTQKFIFRNISSLPTWRADEIRLSWLDSDVL